MAKDKRINLRVTTDEYEQLAREAGGKATITDVIRAHVFGGGMRNHDALRQVAALHEVGMAVRRLAERPTVSAADAAAAIAAARVAIDKLARTLP